MCGGRGILNKLHLLLGTKRWRSNRGAVAVEFALVLILLSLILFGTIEFGWAFFTKAIVTNAAREGARLAVTPFATTAAVKTQVQSYLDNFFLTGTLTIDVEPSVSIGPPPSPGSGTPVTVTVSYIYAPLTGRLIASSNWTIVANATMRRE